MHRRSAGPKDRPSVTNATEMGAVRPRRRAKRAANSPYSGRRVQPSGPKPIIRGAELEIYRRLCEKRQMKKD